MGVFTKTGLKLVTVVFSLGFLIGFGAGFIGFAWLVEALAAGAK